MNGDSSMTISIVTRCMDRRSFLEQSLPTWLPLPIREIIIVDWGMLEPLDDLCNLDPRITILHVPNQKYFDAGRAINTGVDYAASDLIFHIDADIKLGNVPASVFDTITRIFEIPYIGLLMADIEGLCGTCLFRQHAWHRAGGYFEGLHSWGMEDLFFYKCVQQYYKAITFFDFHEFSHIRHNDVLRYEHMRVKGIRADDTHSHIMIENTPWPQQHFIPEYTTYGNRLH